MVDFKYVLRRLCSVGKLGVIRAIIILVLGISTPGEGYKEFQVHHLTERYHLETHG